MLYNCCYVIYRLCSDRHNYAYRSGYSEYDI